MENNIVSLKQILNGLDYEIIMNGSLHNVNDIQINSKLISKGNMYVAIEGEKMDGHEFVKEAYQKGASFFVINRAKYSEMDLSFLTNVTLITVLNTRESLSQIVNNFYSNPSKNFKLIGVTGTNGKTSVTTIASYVFQKLHYRTGLIGTIDNYINHSVLDIAKTNPTTPDCIELGKIMDAFVKENVEVALMEVSSMALKTHRVDQCQFDIAVYTNISPEHLDNHKTMEDYLNSKLRLFRMADQAVVNIDDEQSGKVIEQCPGKILKYGIKNPQLCDIYAKNIHYTGEKVRFTVVYQNEELPLTIHTPSEFAIYNNLAVFGICLMIGIKIADILGFLQDDIPVEGRYDVINSGQSFHIIIDYAHTPAALENIINAVRKNDSYKRIITVFGCGGDRDKSKRSIMGQISQHLSDITIVTSDNPRTENPDSIIKDILMGMDEALRNYFILPDRKEAIEYAAAIAEAGDAIIIAGKGHEKVQILNGYTIEFNDKEEVLAALKTKPNS